MSGELKKYFNSVIVGTADPKSGWCGSNTLACNMLTRQVPYLQSPYQIEDDSSKNINLYNTIHNSIDYSKKYEGFIPRSCNPKNISQVPCWGGLGVSGGNTNMTADSGCDGSNPNWTYPKTVVTDGASKNSLPAITDPSSGTPVTIGLWKDNIGFGPKKADNFPKPDNGEVWNSEHHYSTSILASLNPSQGIHGSMPTIAKVYINYVKSTVNGSLLDESDDFMSAIIKKIANNVTIPESNLKNKISETKKNIVNLQLNQILSSVMSEEGNSEALSEFMTSFSTYLSLHKELVIHYATVSPIIRIINNILIENLVVKECRSTKQPIERIQCQVKGYQKAINIVSKTGNAFLNNNTSAIRSNMNAFIGFCQSNEVNILDPQAVVFKAVSVSFIMSKGCSITGDSGSGGSFPFRYASPLGVCLPDGCKVDSTNDACSCVDDNTYRCPFEVFPNNITSCQAIILDKRSNAPYKSMKSKVINWFNTFVGMNGCIQRALGMKFGKCVKLNEKSLTGVYWMPGKGGFSTNATIDTKIYEREK